MKINLPELLWYGNTTFDIELPDHWNTVVCPMNGFDSKPMTTMEMASSIKNPINSKSIRELAIGKKTAAIVFDDMTRPTRISELAPIVIEELVAGGISEDNIIFVCALGTHGALTQNEFRKKLGLKIVKKFRVFNHNIYENCKEIGTTSRGTKMMINRGVAESDLKIGIGCVTPHAQTGFSGGGKLILPGIAHIDSISHFHIEVESMDKESTGMGKLNNNIMRMEIDEASQLAGIDFFVNAIVNGRGYTTDVFAGDLMDSHSAAVKKAIKHYATEPVPLNKDLTIANAFVKANEMAIAMLLGLIPLKNFSGTVVAIANSPEGQVIHYLLGRFGRDFGGRLYPVGGIPPSVNFIVMAPHLDKTFGDWFVNPEVITWTENWEQTMELLKPDFGPGTEVAVIPNATMQYYDL